MSNKMFRPKNNEDYTARLTIMLKNITPRKILGLMMLSLLLLSCSHSDISVSKQKAKTAEALVNIPSKNFVLGNGLTLVVHEDHSDPLVHVDVTYHVGSSREEPGKSGFAHLFEHMMFQGSAHVDDDEHLKLISEAGGSANGSTNRDRTNYYQTVPSNELETVLWLESDRMGFFVEGITQKKFEIQRATVKNEKQQNYDNRPYGGIFERAPKALYPKGHPYSWLTIGDLEDLDRADASDLQRFFEQWYTPNNATITIGGNVNTKDVLALVEKYFGSFPKGPNIPRLKSQPVTLDQNRYISYKDNNIRFPALVTIWPTVAKFHPDAPALRCLAQLLGSGKNSYLYRNFVAENLAINVNASNRTDEIAGEFSTFVLPYPGESLTETQSRLNDTLKEFERSGVSDDDIEKYKSRYEASFVRSLETVAGKVSKLAYYQTFAGSPQAFNIQFERNQNITKEDVMRVFRTYIKDKHSLTVSALASESDLPPQPDNINVKTDKSYIETKNPVADTDHHNAVEAAHSEIEKDLAYTDHQRRNKVIETFDRSKRPKIPAASLNPLPDYWQKEAENGLNIIGTQSDELPMVTIKLSMPGGISADTSNMNKLGLAFLTASLMNTSTKNYSEAEIAEKLERIGSSISFEAGTHRFTARISTLTKNLDETLDIFEEKLFQPAFSEQDFISEKKRLLESAKSSTENISSIATTVFDRLVYGKDHIFGAPNSEIINTIDNITIDDVKKMYDVFFSANQSDLIIVSNLSKKKILDKLNFLQEWDKPAAPTIDYPATPTIPGNTLYLVDKPNVAQSEIIIGYMTNLPYDASGEFYKRNLMNFSLGGGFSSRINLNLREDKGITYGARTSFSGSEMPGPFRAKTSVKKDETHVAVQEIFKEIANMHAKGISAEELDFMKRAIGQSDALKYESSYSKAGILEYILRFDLDENYDKTRQETINRIDQAEIARLAGKHLPPEKMIAVIVGDKSKIMNSLRKAKNHNNKSFDIIELSTDGSKINP